MLKAHFFVEGLPVPQGSVQSFGGHVVAVTPKLREWREAVKQAAIQTEWGQGQPFDGPVTLTVTFYLPRPHKPKCNVPSVKPDGDKLLRAIQDALTATKEGMTRGKRPKIIPASPGLITNDSRIVDGTYRKRYAQDGIKPGAFIFLRELDLGNFGS